jgi:hypothetical protein
MGRQSVDEATARARFSVREMTNSPVTNENSQSEERHAQRLRDLGISTDGWGDER